MTYTLTIYKTKKMLIIGGILILTLFPLVMVISVLYLNAIAAVIGILAIIPITILIGLNFSRKAVHVLLDDFKIQFESTDILLENIVGYYINRKSPIMTQIEFKDINNNNYRLTSLNFGKKGKDFESFLFDLLKKVHLANKGFSELSFYDFHNSQYKFSRVFIYLIMIVTILLNLIYFYLVLFKHVAFNWKLLFVNIMFLGLYNFHKENVNK